MHNNMIKIHIGFGNNNNYYVSELIKAMDVRTDIDYFDIGDGSMVRLVRKYEKSIVFRLMDSKSSISIPVDSRIFIDVPMIWSIIVYEGKEFRLSAIKPSTGSGAHNQWGLFFKSVDSVEQLSMDGKSFIRHFI